MSAIREMFVRDAVKEVLRQCEGLTLLESTLMQQVNLTLAPVATPAEIASALKQLQEKGRIEFVVDEEDANIKRWRLRK